MIIEVNLINPWQIKENISQVCKCTVFWLFWWQRVNSLLGVVIFLEPYTCGACGIQFQFYNNLLEHMQSHAGEFTNTDKPWAYHRDKWIMCTSPHWQQGLRCSFLKLCSILMQSFKKEIVIRVVADLDLKLLWSLSCWKIFWESYT